ncbi:MAG: NUDIX hydrolase [Anaerolineae bacterium]|nr:NUDIX hydrolase [Anaerolineae bacterium]
MSQDWKTTNKRTVLQNGKFLTVEYHTVELPDGTVIEDWSWVITPDFINVVIIDEDGRFVLFRQTKYGIEGDSLATVGGYIEDNEDPLAAAKREMLEETGYEAPNWISFGSFRVDANRGAGMAYAYLATGAKKVTEPDADDLEEQELVLLSRSEVETALFKGEFKVLPWTGLVALSLLHLDKNNARYS